MAKAGRSDAVFGGMSPACRASLADMGGMCPMVRAGPRMSLAPVGARAEPAAPEAGSAAAGAGAMARLAARSGMAVLPPELESGGANVPVDTAIVGAIPGAALPIGPTVG